MKNLFLTAVFLFSALCVNAQKELAVEKQYPGDARAQKRFETAASKQASEKTTALRTTWVANRPGDNWFLSIQGGGSGIISQGNTYIGKPLQWFDKTKRENEGAYWYPTAGVSLGKWFSPVWGLRVDANYGQLQSFSKNDVKDRDYFDFTSFTMNYVVNLKNFFTPYNPKAFFNPVLYVGAGTIYGGKIWKYTGKGGDKEGNCGFHMTEKAGLQLNFRLGSAVNLFLDGNAQLMPTQMFSWNWGVKNAKGVVANSGLITSASIGFTFNFPFRSFIAAPFNDPAVIDALNAEISQLRNELKKWPAACPPAKTVECPPVPQCPPCPTVPVTPPPVQTQELTPVFFTKGSAVVRDNQLASVAKAAEYLINHPGSKLELASYADKKTGSAALNMQLSKKRSDAVAKVLVNKYHIDKNRLILKSYGDTVQPFAENDWNRVTIFVHP
jgi:outer membrane protein OmpA-like peptidoglycan-associated protein